MGCTSSVLMAPRPEHHPHHPTNPSQTTSPPFNLDSGCSPPPQHQHHDVPPEDGTSSSHHHHHRRRSSHPRRSLWTIFGGRSVHDLDFDSAIVMSASESHPLPSSSLPSGHPTGMVSHSHPGTSGPWSSLSGGGGDGDRTITGAHRSVSARCCCGPCFSCCCSKPNSVSRFLLRLLCCCGRTRRWCGRGVETENDRSHISTAVSRHCLTTTIAMTTSQIDGGGAVMGPFPSGIVAGISSLVKWSDDEQQQQQHHHHHQQQQLLGIRGPSWPQTEHDQGFVHNVSSSSPVPVACLPNAIPGSPQFPTFPMFPKLPEAIAESRGGGTEGEDELTASQPSPSQPHSHSQQPLQPLQRTPAFSAASAVLPVSPSPRSSLRSSNVLSTHPTPRAGAIQQNNPFAQHSSSSFPNSSGAMAGLEHLSLAKVAAMAQWMEAVRIGHLIEPPTEPKGAAYGDEGASGGDGGGHHHRRRSSVKAPQPSLSDPQQLGIPTASASMDFTDPAAVAGMDYHSSSGGEVRENQCRGGATGGTGTGGEGMGGGMRSASLPTSWSRECSSIDTTANNNLDALSSSGQQQQQQRPALTYSNLKSLQQSLSDSGYTPASLLLCSPRHHPKQPHHLHPTAHPHHPYLDVPAPGALRMSLSGSPSSGPVSLSASTSLTTSGPLMSPSNLSSRCSGLDRMSGIGSSRGVAPRSERSHQSSARMSRTSSAIRYRQQPQSLPLPLHQPHPPNAATPGPPPHRHHRSSRNRLKPLPSTTMLTQTVAAAGTSSDVVGLSGGGSTDVVGTTATATVMDPALFKGYAHDGGNEEEETASVSETARSEPETPPTVSSSSSSSSSSSTGEERTGT